MRILTLACAVLLLAGCAAGQAAQETVVVAQAPLVIDGGFTINSVTLSQAANVYRYTYDVAAPTPVRVTHTLAKSNMMFDPANAMRSPSDAAQEIARYFRLSNTPAATSILSVQNRYGTAFLYFGSVGNTFCGLLLQYLDESQAIDGLACRPGATDGDRDVIRATMRGVVGGIRPRV